MGLGITMCLTAGGRPDLLEDTLTSLLPHNGQFFDAILIANDVGDQQTSDVARQFAPGATILHHETRMGHHATVDDLYGRVTTPYIFHCEDDWHFDPVAFVPDALALLEANPTASLVSVRQSACLYHWRHEPHPFLPPPDWNGYGFSPCLTRRALWQEIGPFANFDNERAIDLAVTARGLAIHSLVPGICYHTGGGRHVKDPKHRRPTRAIRWWQRFERKVEAFRQMR
jgi:hypothetical protein